MHLAYPALMIASLAQAPPFASPATPTDILMATIAAHVSAASLPMALSANPALSNVLLVPVPQTAPLATAIELLSTLLVFVQVPSTQWLGQLVATPARSVVRLVSPQASAQLATQQNSVISPVLTAFA